MCSGGRARSSRLHERPAHRSLHTGHRAHTEARWPCSREGNSECTCELPPLGREMIKSINKPLTSKELASCPRPALRVCNGRIGCSFLGMFRFVFPPPAGSSGQARTCPLPFALCPIPLRPLPVPPSPSARSRFTLCPLPLHPLRLSQQRALARPRMSSLGLRSHLPLPCALGHVSVRTDVFFPSRFQGNGIWPWGRRGRASLYLNDVPVSSPGKR